MKYLRKFNESKKLVFGQNDEDDDLELVDEDESGFLYLDDSNITGAGTGLFTAIDIEDGELISKYIGEVISDKEAERRIKNGEDQYFMNDPVTGKIFDCKRKEGFAKYSNDAYRTKFRNNAKIALVKKRGKYGIYLQAIRNIKAGSEILTSYGSAYWKKHGKNIK